MKKHLLLILTASTLFAATSCAPVATDAPATPATLQNTQPAVTSPSLNFTDSRLVKAYRDHDYSDLSIVIEPASDLSNVVIRVVLPDGSYSSKTGGADGITVDQAGLSIGAIQQGTAFEVQDGPHWVRFATAVS